ncbi:MAG: hypothetical protein ACKOBV_07530, partial [Candidatus Kapaibacterium sp.]
RDTVIDAGVHEPCDLPVRYMVHARNTGTLRDTLVLDTAGLHPALRLASQLVIEAGAEDSTAIVFSPAGLPPQTRRQDLRWKSIVCGRTVTLTFTATIVDPHLRITPSSIDAGTLWKGSTATFTVGIVNPSVVPRTILRWYVRGTDATAFTAGAPSKTLLAPQDSVSMTVTALSLSEGKHDAELVIVETGSCTDSTVIPLTSATPREVYRAHLSVENGVVVDVNDTADVHVVLTTVDTSDQALSKAQPRELTCSLRFNRSLMNVLDVFHGDSATAVRLPWVRSAEGIRISFPARLLPDLGRSDTIGIIRAQGMQSIPNVTDITVTDVTADVPADKSVELTWDDGDFAVQSCVKWARVTVAEPMQVTVRSVPADDLADLDVRHHASALLSVRLFTLTGELVHAGSVTVPTDAAVVRIPVSGLPTGAYLLTIEDAMGQRQCAGILVRH